MTKYFLYARKSTDVEDKQVRSIEDQLAVLRALAKDEGLNIADTFIEKRSAKQPGRPVFNEMLDRIQRDEAQSILCWKLDRLSRNPEDSGRIQWLLQENIIRHIRTYERSYYPADNVLLTSVEFGVANQYIRDLSANTKRGLHEKAKRGDYPSNAPLGYLNDPRTKTIVVDRKEAKIVRAAFELYAEGNARLEDVSMFLYKNGIRTKATQRWRSEGGKPLSRDQVSFMLSNPFYIGLFRYAGEIYEGKHKPIVSKRLFDKVQEVLKKRGWQDRKQNDPKPLCGLFHCGECGAAITAEDKVKRQKNGNVHRYTYYHCTKKKGTCSQPCIREEALASKLSSVLQNYAMPSDWAAELSKIADRDEKETAQSSAMASQAMREEVSAISGRLKRLRGVYIDGEIEPEEYRTDKAELLSHKKTLEEKIADVGKGVIAWLEPLREWIKDAEMVGETAVSPSLLDKKSLSQKIFGSNLSLKNREIAFTPITPYAALRAARENFGKIELSCLLVGVEGIGPSTSVLSGQRSTTELRAPSKIYCVTSHFFFNIGPMVRRVEGKRLYFQWANAYVNL